MDQTAVTACRFMSQMLGDQPEQHFPVEEGVCESCCLSFEPTSRDLNVVVASLLFNECDNRLENIAPEDPRIQSLKDLQAHCESSLPVMGIHENDLPLKNERLSVVPSLKRIQEVLPAPDLRHGNFDQWAVGLTTTPRRLPTLDRSLQQFLSCGWDEVHLFVDGEVLLPQQYQHLPQTHRSPNIGAWPNYYLGLQELVHRHPKADVYMMLQDDLEWPVSWPLKNYLEQVLWPGKEPCLVSTYCGAEEATEEFGWSQSSHWKWGALGFLFPRELLFKFLADERVRNHIHNTDGSALVGIDIQIGDWAKEHNIPVYRPCPSLVQHMGEISSIWPTSRAVGVRAASQFIVDYV